MPCERDRFGLDLGGTVAKISGAIFDCDGTLLDSMGMWMGVFGKLLANHGIEATPEMQSKIEAMTLPKTGIYLHNEFGMCASPEEVVDQIHELVIYEYEHNIAEMPGAHAFVESLAAAGVPMVVASSTTSSVVRRALDHFGMLGLFEDVLCTAEVREGRDKDFPDVYLAARERLGTPLDETWVFEDAPFAVRSARRGGFYVVGIHNDHDGRDPEFISSWADIFTENYDSVSLDAIRAFDDAARTPSPEEA